MPFDWSALLSGLLSYLERIPSKTSFALGLAIVIVFQINAISPLSTGLVDGWFYAQVAMIGCFCLSAVSMVSAAASAATGWVLALRSNHRSEFSGMFQRMHAMKKNLQYASHQRQKIPGTLFDKGYSFELHAIYVCLRQNGVSTPSFDPRRGHIKIDLHLGYLESIIPLLTNLGEAKKISREMENVAPLNSSIQRLIHSVCKGRRGNAW